VNERPISRYRSKFITWISHLDIIDIWGVSYIVAKNSRRQLGILLFRYRLLHGEEAVRTSITLYKRVCNGSSNRIFRLFQLFAHVLGGCVLKDDRGHCKTIWPGGDGRVLLFVECASSGRETYIPTQSNIGIAKLLDSVVSVNRQLQPCCGGCYWPYALGGWFRYLKYYVPVAFNHIILCSTSYPHHDVPVPLNILLYYTPSRLKVTYIIVTFTD